MVIKEASKFSDASFIILKPTSDFTACRSLPNEPQFVRY